MICPHCDYQETVYGTKKKEKWPGDLGRFYEPRGNSLQLTRKNIDNRHTDIASIVGCPRCKKLFILED